MKPILSLYFFCLCLGSTLYAAAQPKTKNNNAPNHAIISIRIEGSAEGDSVMTEQWTFNMRTPETHKVNWVLIHNNEIEIHFDSMHHPGYFGIFYRKRKNLLPSVTPVEPGDRVKIICYMDSISYAGPGCQKMKCWYQINQSRDNFSKKAPKFAHLKNKNLMYDFSEASTQAGIDILVSHRSKVSPLAYQLLKADLIGGDLFYRLEISGFEFYNSSDSASQGIYRTLYQRFNQTEEALFKMIQEQTAARSFYWADFVLKKYIIDSFRMPTQKTFDLPVACRYITNNYRGILRDHLLTTLLLKYHRNSDSLVTCLQEAERIVKDSELLSVLRKQNAHFLQGTPAYNFSLRDTTGKLVRLSDFKGKTVVMDFWYTGCMNCIEASTALQPVEELFKETKDLIFVSICIDSDKNTWIKGIKDGKYTTPGRTNLYTDQRGAADPLIKYYDIYGYPTFMLIDKKGNLFSARLPDPRGHSEKLIEQIKEALAK